MLTSLARACAIAAAAGCFLPAGASGGLALAWLGVALCGLMRGRWTARPEGLKALLAWSAWMLLSLGWSGLGWAEVARPASHVVMMLALPAMAGSLAPQAASQAVRGFVAAAVVLALAWVWHALQPWPLGRPWSSLVHYVGNKSIANGVLLALAATLALREALDTTAARRWWWCAAFAVIAASVLWRSPSRTAQGCLLLLPLALAWWRAGNWRARTAVVAVAAALVLAGALWISHGAAGSGLAARGAAGQLQASDDNRRSLYTATWAMIKERPLIGHGLGSWLPQWRQRNQRSDMRDFNTAHSAPLELWAEGGAIALVLLGAAAFGWLAAARRAGLSGLGAPLALALLGWGLESIVNASLRDAVFTAPMLVLCALGLALVPRAPAGIPESAR